MGPSGLARARRRLRRLLLRVFPRLGLRHDDVFLASFPKSGNTWVRFLWANVVALEEMDGREIDFHVLEEVFGAEYGKPPYGDPPPDRLPRLVKTHRAYDRRAFGGHRSVYVLRHPGDVMISSYHYYRGRRSEGRAPEDLDAFLRSGTLGIPAWCRHVRSWIDEATTTVRYRALQRDAAGTLDRMLSDLGLAGIPRARLAEAARRSSFASLRRLEEERGRPREERFEREHRFMRRGETGEWREVLDEKQRTYLEEEVERRGLDHVVETAADEDGAR